MIFSELKQSKQRQEVLEKRLSKMVEVLMKACHSMGIGAVSDQDIRGMHHQQIENDPSDDNKRFKRARLTMENQGQKGDRATSSSYYKQTDEWLDSLMQGMSNISETQGQGCFGGGHHQMRITHGNMSTASTQHSALTEIHEKDDVHYNIDDENHIDFMSKHISTGVVAAGAPPLLLGIYDEETRLSVPHSPAVDSVTLDTRSEAGEDLAKSLGSQTLDLDTLLSPSAALMLPVHMSPVAAATSQSDEVARGSLISCSQAAEMARQAKAESMVG